MKRFAQGLLTGCIGALGGVAMLYAALAWLLPASFPAPAITPVAALDEKLRFLRQHPEFDPRIVAVGSSITFRQLTGASFERIAGGRNRFLNGATNGLKVHQTHDLVEFYLENFPNVHTVLVMTGLPDFENCTTAPRTLFDHDDAKAYAFDEWPAAYFYFRYFSPQRFARTAATLAERQKPLLGDLYMDAHGAGPLQVPEEMQRGLRYEEIDFDPACVDDLIELSAALTERGVSLKLVFPPLHPEYRQTYPDAVPTTCRIAREIQSATGSHMTDVLVLHDDASFDDDDFYDAFHLQHAAAKRLSAQVARWMERSTTSVAKVQVAIDHLQAKAAIGKPCESEPPSS